VGSRVPLSVPPSLILALVGEIFGVVCVCPWFTCMRERERDENMKAILNEALDKGGWGQLAQHACKIGSAAHEHENAKRARKVSSDSGRHSLTSTIAFLT